MHLYALRDNISATWLAPWPAITAGTAERNVYDMIAAGNNPVANHPGDHDLYRLCPWDPAAGLTPLCDGVLDAAELVSSVANIAEAFRSNL